MLLRQRASILVHARQGAMLAENNGSSDWGTEADDDSRSAANDQEEVEHARRLRRAQELESAMCERYVVARRSSMLVSPRRRSV
mmetsp:Transcript_36295/g.100179  ORF Transcript_36295/g.100179 Transcript_36295/m.100179 type:complete len:84 (-) Transcript_36295:227-478(-)